MTDPACPVGAASSSSISAMPCRAVQCIRLALPPAGTTTSTPCCHRSWQADNPHLQHLFAKPAHDDSSCRGQGARSLPARCRRCRSEQDAKRARHAGGGSRPSAFAFATQPAFNAVQMLCKRFRGGTSSVNQAASWTCTRQPLRPLHEKNHRAARQAAAAVQPAPGAPPRAPGPAQMLALDPQAACAAAASPLQFGTYLLLVMRAGAGQPGGDAAPPLLLDSLHMPDTVLRQTRLQLRCFPPHQ